MPVSKTRKRPVNRTGVATHRPATRKRHFRHDDPIAVDMFSGFGGLTRGIEEAGFTTILAANHNWYKTAVHELNHPYAEHWIADLVDPDSSDYHSAEDLPAADLLVAGVSCTSHSQANTQRAYAQGMTLFDLAGVDEEYEARVTKSERDRATALCVLQYAQKHHPSMILIECTTELQSWGNALPNKPKIGDGTTYRWWLRMLKNLNYNYQVLYLNSMFFGVGQSRDRLYIVFWDKRLPAPDLDHRPETFCASCDQVVEAVWTWRTGVPASGTVRYGVQYDYRCPRCRSQIVPPMTPALAALDLSDLGTRIGDRKKPLAGSTMGRAERCRQRLPEFAPIIMSRNALGGLEGHPWAPAARQGDQVMSGGAAVVAAGNTFERPGSDCRSRDLSQPLWTQPATNTVGLLTPPVALGGTVIAAHKHNGDGKHISQPMDTNTSTYEKGVVFAAVDNFQGVSRSTSEPLPTQGGSETMALVSTGVMPLRKAGAPRGVDGPLPAVTASETLSLVSAGVIPFRQNTVPTTHAEAMPTVTAEQLPGLIATETPVPKAPAGWGSEQLMALWRDALAGIRLEDMHFRMLFKWEVGEACGFHPVDFPGRNGDFQVWGTAEQQIDGYGNAVSPGVGKFLGLRLRDCLHRSQGILPRQRQPI